MFSGYAFVYTQFANLALCSSATVANSAMPANPVNIRMPNLPSADRNYCINLNMLRIKCCYQNFAKFMGVCQESNLNLVLGHVLLVYFNYIIKNLPGLFAIN